MFFLCQQLPLVLYRSGLEDLAVLWCSISRISKALSARVTCENEDFANLLHLVENLYDLMGEPNYFLADHINKLKIHNLLHYPDQFKYMGSSHFVSTEVNMILFLRDFFFIFLNLYIYMYIYFCYRLLRATTRISNIIWRLPTKFLHHEMWL